MPKTLPHAVAGHRRPRKKYDDIIDLSIGDTDFITDGEIIDAAFRDAKLGYTHYGDPKGDKQLIAAICDAWHRTSARPSPRITLLLPPAWLSP